MDTITDINKSSLAGLLAALAQAKMKVGSIANADGSYTVTYEPLPFRIGRSPAQRDYAEHTARCQHG
ncbi:hypothetical protein AS026_08015 [Rhizobium altiplani]|jgi:hypothetical protein|uniref:Uncharacterized protein n=1 Tax=Rhizobium altiplani TaxID=1864509 RepID=A0A120FKH3_9HYPH|nr:hypothetical protein [Rhizobium altiplani]KWV50705.1 hypothetical protein AS026_08015 [Rhizobium altiplani]